MVTNPQFEVLKGIQDNLNISEIASYRKCSRQAIYKILRRLLDFGMVEKIGYSYSLTQKGIEGLHSFVGLRYNLRQHNLHFKIKVLENPKNWDKKRQKLILLPYFNKRIKLKNNIQDLFNFGKVQVKTTNKSVIVKIPTIYTKTTGEAIIQSFDALYGVIPKIEKSFKIRLVKDYKANIEIISQEYASINDTLAKIYRREANKLYITDEEGKVWLIADYSFNNDELETISPTSADEDMNSVRPFLNDLRKNPTTFSEVREVVNGMLQTQQMNADNIIKHQKVLDEMLKTLKKIQKSLERR